MAAQNYEAKAKEEQDEEDRIFHRLQEEQGDVRQIMFAVYHEMRRSSKYNPQLTTKMADQFITFINEEAFNNDEETLRLELQSTLNESQIVDNLAECFPEQLGSELAKQDLVALLQRASFDPSTLDLKGYLDKITWILTKQQSSKTEQFLMDHCREFVQPQDQQNHRKNLIDVVAIGRKNDIPLLSWLNDTSARFRINEYYRTEKKTALTVKDWEKTYPLFEELEQKRRDSILHAFRSFSHRMFRSIAFDKIVLIDDDIVAYYTYLNAMLQAVDALKGTHTLPFFKGAQQAQLKTYCPLQIDLWIIPRNVVSTVHEIDNEHDDQNDAEDVEETPDDLDDDEKELKEDDSDDVGKDLIGDLQKRFEAAKWKHDKYTVPKHKMSSVGLLARHIGQGVEKSLSDRRNQRIIVYIDRRRQHSDDDPEEDPEDDLNNNSKDKPQDMDKGASSGDKPSSGDDLPYTMPDENDTIYIVQPSEERFSAIPSDFSPETLFWSSTQCLLPRLQSEGAHGRRSFGCQHPFNGFQFTLSWHIESADVSRCYWFSGHWGTRFFPVLDAERLWPDYFVEQKENQSTNIEHSLRQLRRRKPLEDAKFQEWFEHTTKSRLLVF